MNKLHYRTCLTCKVEKHTSEFDKYISNNCKHESCRNCEIEKEKITQELKDKNILICFRCKVTKDRVEFYNSKVSKTGKVAACKECVNKEHKLYREKNPEQEIKRRKDYHQKNKTIINEKSKIKRQKHKFFYMAITTNKRFKQCSNLVCENILPFQLWCLARKQKLRCAISGIKLTNKNISIDHIIPICKNGTNRIDNLQFLDRHVNSMKNSHSQEDFIKIIKTILEYQSTLEKQKPV